MDTEASARMRVASCREQRQERPSVPREAERMLKLWTSLPQYKPYFLAEDTELHVTEKLKFLHQVRQVGCKIVTYLHLAQLNCGE